MTMTVSSAYLVGLGSLIGMDDPAPTLAWKLTSTVAGDQPTAYEVQVGTTLDASDYLATGKVVSSTIQSVRIPRGLKSATRYFVRVRAWDASNVASDWCCIQIETGLWSLRDWRGAQWIGLAGTPAPQLRTDFTTTSGVTVAKARLYIAAGGYAEVTINGTQVSDALSPGFTNYSKRVQYTTTDVTAQIVAAGANALAVTLGRGFFGCTTTTDWGWKTAPWAGDPRLLALLVVTYSDGTTQVVKSDGTWKAKAGPTQADSVYLGESYDARLETPGWQVAGFDASAWVAASVVSAPAGALTAQCQQPIRAGAALSPTATATPASGGTRYTFPKIMTGWVRLKVTASAGTAVTVKYAEKLNADGTLYMDNSAVTGQCQTDTYICKGGGQEVWSPRFSYKGFRYIDVLGATPDEVTAIPVWTDYAQIGQWSSSSALLNQLHGMSAQSVRINSHGIPQDTPTYERNGWLGDSNVMCRSALYMWDIGPMYRKWLTDMADDMQDNGMLHNIVPSPGFGLYDDINWSTAIILVTYEIWLRTGDVGMVAQLFERMRQYLSHVLTAAPGPFTAQTTYGDWGSPAGNYQDGPRDMVSAAIVMRSLRAMADMSDSLGLSYGTDWRATAIAIAARLNTALRQSDGTYLPGAAWSGQVQQTPMVLALREQVCAGSDATATAVALQTNVATTKSNHTSCGIVGGERLLEVLTEAGYVDTALAVALKQDYPSWGAWASLGATTTWNGFTWYELGTRSLSHQMHGSYVAWMYRHLAGIDITGPGSMVIKPYVPSSGLDTVQATVETARGPVSTSRSGKALTVTIPPGVIATYQGSALSSGVTNITLP